MGRVVITYPGHFTPGTQWTRSWVGPRANLDTYENRKISCRRHESKHDSQAVQPVV